MIVVSFLSTVLAIYFVIPWLYGWWLRGRLRGCIREQRAICITLDDGPGTRLTPRILEILAEHAIPATFFLLGRNIQGREMLVRRMVAEGHDICSHGFDHLHAWKTWPWQGIQDIKKGWRAIDAVLDVPRGVYPFRPPYGKLNVITLLYLWIRRVPIIYWTADTRDTWSQVKKDRRGDRSWLRDTQGAVVLAHDFDRATDGVDAYVLQVVEECISTARESQLKMCSLSELSRVI